MINLTKGKFFPMIMSAVTMFFANTNCASAESVSVSASISTQISVEVAADTAAPVVRKTEGYTGVIVDCRGLDLRRAMSPVIQAENGKIIYGDKDLDFDKINEIGMAEYATDIHSATRAGSKPLIVRAVGLSNFNSNPVLSSADAKKVLITNQYSGYLKNLSVVFLTD